MVVIKKDEYLLTAKIPVGRFFGAPDADATIELREPDTLTLTRMHSAKETGDDAFIQMFRDILPGLIVTHNLYKSETEKLDTVEVRDVIFDKLEIFSYVIDVYSREVLFFLGEKSAGK